MNVIDLFVTFIISVAAGIVAYYICKWLDRLAETRVSAYRLPRGRLNGVAAVTPLHGT